MLKHHRHKLLLLLALAAMLATTGLGCKGGNVSAQKALEEEVTLNVWGVFDGTEAFADLIRSYTSTRTNVRINYRKLQFAEYERALLEAWAENRGPDIFMVHNTWVGGYVNKISPPPEKIKVVAANVTGTYKKNVEAFFVDYLSVTPDVLRSDFLEVVAQDAVRNGQVYGLPLSVDTLALFYNRALLDQAGIPSVPKTWQEVKLASQRLTLADEDGAIVRSGIALGGADNINRSFDVLSLLMAQNGTAFLTPNGQAVTFAQAAPNSVDRTYRPGEAALQFYTDFANPAKEVYNWHEEMPEAQEQFMAGTLAMMLGYNYQLPLLRAQAAGVRLGVAPVPHINADGSDATGETVNWANYWLLTVAQSSQQAAHAWDFIHYAAADPEHAKLYLAKTKKPAALRSLINNQLTDPELGVFASQLLTARSWYTGLEAVAVENIFKDLITAVAQNKSPVKDAIRRAETLVSQTLK